MLRELTAVLATLPLVAFRSLFGEAFTVRWIDWRASSGEDRSMTAAGGGWLVVPRLGRVEEAVGATLGAVRAARDRRPRRAGMAAMCPGG
jgi:hypothetical protein